MPKLPRVSGAEAVRALERLGFEKVRQSGSHLIMRGANATASCPCIVSLRLAPFLVSSARQTCLRRISLLPFGEYAHLIVAADAPQAARR
jgi:hypothetical protein